MSIQPGKGVNNVRGKGKEYYPSGTASCGVPATQHSSRTMELPS